MDNDILLLHLLCTFSKFVFCFLLFVCNPALWLLYINKVVLCYVSRVRIRAIKTFGHRHDRACTDFSPVEIDRRAKFGCCVIRMFVGKGPEFFWGTLGWGRG